MKFAAKLLLLLAIPALHVVAIFYLYRGRHLAQIFYDSDAIVFFLPSAFAYAAYFVILLWMRRSADRALLMSIGATLGSFWLAMVVALNSFGG